MNKPRCGAKTRDGTPCQQYPLQGKTRCKLHGGKSTGAGAGNQNASTHGIYKSVLSEEEQARWHDIEIGRLDDELRLWRTRLLRALAAEHASKTTAAGSAPSLCLIKGTSSRFDQVSSCSIAAARKVSAAASKTECP